MMIHSFDANSANITMRRARRSIDVTGRTKLDSVYFERLRDNIWNGDMAPNVIIFWNDQEITFRFVLFALYIDFKIQFFEWFPAESCWSWPSHRNCQTDTGSEPQSTRNSAACCTNSNEISRAERSRSGWAGMWEWLASFKGYIRMSVHCVEFPVATRVFLFVLLYLLLDGWWIFHDVLYI